MPPNNADNTPIGGPEPNTIKVANEALRHGFTIIPNYVLRSTDLSRDAKLLYGILLSYAWQKGSCFPGYEALQKDMSCGSAQISRYIKELRDSGWLNVTRRGQGRTNIYTLKDPIRDTLFFQNERTRTTKSKEPEPTESKEKEYSWNKTHEKDSDHSNIRMVDQSGRKRGDGADPPADESSPDFQALGAILKEKRPQRQQEPYPEDRQVLLEYISDFSRELGDQASVKSSTTRAVNLFRRSGLSREAFIACLYEARSITKERTAAIRTTSKEPGRPFPTTHKMAYFYAILEERLGLREPPTSRKPDSAAAPADTNESNSGAPRSQKRFNRPTGP